MVILTTSITVFTMKMKLFRTLPVIFSLVLCLVLAPDAQGRVYLDITSAEYRDIPVAVPYLVDKDKPDSVYDSGREMAELVGRALAFHGFISIIDPVTYGGRQSADWQALGAEFAILGQYESKPSEMVLELRLIDIHEGRMVLGRRYRGKFDRHKDMLLKFCDEVILKLTGEKGISLSKIAFVSDSSKVKEIYIGDVLGDDVRQVTRHNYLAVSPRFSPDGSLLAYTSYHRGNPNLYVTELNQSQVTRAISRRQGLNMAPAWSPDGKKMIVTLSKDGNPDLYLMNTKGKILKRLTKNAGINVSPTWSPDGERIAFVSDRTGTPQIYVMDLKTSSVNRITYIGSENTTPSWSPKGDWIAYTALIDGVHHIVIISPEGGNPVRVTKTWGEHESPSWSPDGRQIVFSRSRNGRKQICAIFRNGSGLRTIFDLKGDQSSPQWSPRLSSL